MKKKFSNILQKKLFLHYTVEFRIYFQFKVISSIIQNYCPKPILCAKKDKAGQIEKEKYIKRPMVLYPGQETDAE